MYPRQIGYDEATRFQPRRYEHAIPVCSEIVFPTRGIRGVHAATIYTKDIGQGGAAISVGTLKNVPDHFYLEPKGTNMRIACHVVNRSPGVVNVKFHRDLSEREMAAILESHRKRATG